MHGSENDVCSSSSLPENTGPCATVFQENCSKITVEVFLFIATCGVSLLFLGKTLSGFLSIEKILVEFVRDILEFHVTILLLIDWKARVWVLFHALATRVPRAVLVAVVLG